MESIRLDIIKESNELYIASSPDVKELNFRNNNIPALLEEAAKLTGKNVIYSLRSHI